MEIILESFQVFTALVILLLLIWGDRLTRRIRLRGWKLLIVGLFFVLLGRISDLLGEFESLARIIPVKEGNFFEYPGTIIGISLGLLFVAAGLLFVVPSVYVVLSTKRNIEHSDERYRLITENISDVIFLVDLNFNWLYITPSVLKFRGYTADEALNQNIKDVLTPESIKTVKRVVRKEFLRDRTPGLDPTRIKTMELEFYHKDGTTVWGEVTASFLRDEDGRIIGLQGANRNITERKLNEKALQESEERYRMSFMLSPEAVTLNRLSDGLFVEYNQKFLEHTGYTASDIEGKTGIELGIWADPGERERFREMLIKEGTVQNFEAGIKKKDGTTGTGLISASLVNLSGETHLLTITKDVTEIREAQLALEESEEKFRSTLEAIGDCVIIFDETFNISWANHEARKKIGTLEGMKCYQAIMGLESPCVECNARLTFQDGGIRTTEKQFNIRGDGTENYLVTCAPMRDSQGNITSVVETIKDINELKDTEARLVKTIHEKESLLKEIHHRVKNNLQAISGLLDIQALRSNDSKSRWAIRESQNRILPMALIHEHLYRQQDMSSINFTSYIRQLVPNLKRSYGSDKQSIVIDVLGDDTTLNPDTAIPCSLILTELVSNALQHAFSDGDGRIVIGLDDLGEGTFRMSVTDDGGSLPDEMDIYSTDSFGLMLVRTFVDLLGGKIEVFSGDETKFIITFREYEEAKTLAL